MQFSPSVWTDITTDVIVADVVRGEYGFADNGPTDRVAKTGRLEFSLNNSDTNSAKLVGYYSPGHNNCRNGFTTGIPVRLRVSFENINRTKFYGRIAKDGIVPDTGLYGTRRTRITVLDWMNQAATHQIYLPEYTTNKRIDEIVPLIVGLMPLAPLATEYNAGVDTFPSVFDTVQEKTTALSEFAKLAQSEYGYIYLKHTVDYDEVLVVEGRNARTALSTELDKFPLSAEESGYLLADDGYLLQDNGDRIILNVGTEAYYVDNAIESKVNYGKHMTNYLTTTFHPRKFDTVATVLYSTTSPIFLAAGSSREFTANFRDPANLAVNVAGKSMISPVATTDYWMGTDSAGTGKTLTANLSVTVNYGANAGSYSISNTGTVDGYASLQARGLGIYLYDAVSYISQGTASQASLGLQQMDINMPYQADQDTAETVGIFELLNLQNPRLEMDSWSFYTNTDGYSMLSFLAIEIGDRVHLRESQTGFDFDRYIDGVRFEIYPNNIIKCTWLTRFVSSLTGWFLGIDGSTELGVTTILG
jgi:hypothetical protein